MPGMLHEVIAMMKERGKTMTDMDRLAVICFDERKVNGRVCYDRQMDAVFGPCKQLMVVMVRGLTAAWKQPVFFLLLREDL